MTNAGHNNELVVLIDYDWTLADTTESSADLWGMISEVSNVDLAQVEVDGLGFHLDDLGGYDYQAHIESYGLTPDTMWSRLMELTIGASSQDPPAYIYSDGAPFMSSLIREGFMPGILTFGENRFQLAKILPNLGYITGNEDGPPVSIETVLRPKAEYIAEQYNGRRGVLVDDKPGQKLPKGFTEVHLNRAVFLEEPKIEEFGFSVHNLNQALEVIRSLR